jgi:hypothetical protein
LSSHCPTAFGSPYKKIIQTISVPHKENKNKKYKYVGTNIMFSSQEHSRPYLVQNFIFWLDVNNLSTFL